MTRAMLGLVFCVLSFAVGSRADLRVHEATIAADRGAGVRLLSGHGTTTSVTFASANRRLQQYGRCDCTCDGVWVGSYNVAYDSDCNDAQCASMYSCDGSGGGGASAVRAVVITLVVLIAVGVCIGVIICKVCGCCCFKKPTHVQTQQQYIATGAPVYPGPEYQGAPYAQPSGQPYDAGMYGGAPPGYPAGAPPGVPPGKDGAMPPGPQGNAVDGNFQQAPPPGYPMPAPYHSNEPMPQPGPYPPQPGPYPPQPGPYPPQPGPYPPPQPEPYPLAQPMPPQEPYPAQQPEAYPVPQPQPAPPPQPAQPPAAHPGP